MSNFGRNLALWVIIGLLLVALFNLFQQPSNRGAGDGIPFSEFLAQVETGQVKEVTIKGHEISGFYGDERAFRHMRRTTRSSSSGCARAAWSSTPCRSRTGRRRCSRS